jgi:hypothetical protein
MRENLSVVLLKYFKKMNLEKCVIIITTDKASNNKIILKTIKRSLK